MEQIGEVAKYFLAKEPMTHKKLQKLCYYAQAWYLANFGEPLMSSVFEAWVHGPVSPELYSNYRDWGWLSIHQDSSIQPQITDKRIERYLDLVYKSYGAYSGDQLETFTHQEEPWKRARKGYPPLEHCRVVISEDDMRECYKKRLKISE